MAFVANSSHQIAFYQVSGTTGLTTSAFNIDFFTFNGDNVDATVLATFTITEMGEGYYYATYVPDAAGFYILAFSDSLGTFVADACDIDEANFVNLTQDYPTHNNLKPKLPNTVSLSQGAAKDQQQTLQQYLLMLFNSSDWAVGRTSSDWAVASTELDDQGNWQVTPITVSPGTYHVVIRNNFNVTYVFKPNFEVP